ncbi:MAG: hypothetical protein BWK80_28740 [Desulfobacteraceae bacterium IS3]|nr:MAG: hypothetical protein BWK80_28740 [Desulfobacteraceae bacterium IS3]
MSKCFECSELQLTCCEKSEVCVTKGDIKRIAEYAGRNDFYHLMPVSEELKFIITNPCNPENGSEIYLKYLFDEEGRRIILKKNENRCCFLTHNGCDLPLNIRPIVCRLYPYDWNDNKDMWIDPARLCPENLFKDEQEIKEQLCLPEQEAKRLLELFYDEIKSQKNNLQFRLKGLPLPGTERGESPVPPPALSGKGDGGLGRKSGSQN